MYIIYLLLILIIININRNEAKFVTSEKNFDLLINISKLHFYSDQETYVMDNSYMQPYPYVKEMCRVFSENWPNVLIGDDPDKLYTMPPRRNINILYTELNHGIFSLSSKNKLLFYFDLREDYSTCSKMEYLSKIGKEFIWNEFFQSIFLFHFQKNCSIEYEIWTRAPWSEEPGQKIKNIKDAYFNKKPNFHKAVITLFSTYFERAIHRAVNKSKLEYFQKIWFEKWNIVDPVSTNKPPIWYALIFLEPQYQIPNSDTYKLMSMCFVVQKGKDRPKWKVILWCFHWKVWVMLTVMWLMSGVAWFFLNKKNSLFLSLFQMYSLILTEPIYWLPSLNSNLHRFISGLLMLMSIVIITGFQSNLYKYMQVPPVYPPINEIKQIKDQNLSIICTYAMSCQVIFGFFQGYETDNLLFGINSQLMMTQDGYDLTSQPTLYDVLKNPEYALLTPCDSARLMINKIPTLSKRLHVVKETIISYPLNYENIPFQNEIEHLMLSYYESGIGQWAEGMIEWKKLVKLLLRETEETPIKVFNMDDLQIAFIILFIGLSISTFIFILECISKYWLLH